MNMIFLMGCTCSGKGTFIKWAKKNLRNVGYVEVGEEFRRRYPPGYFQGQANPVHTRSEAMQIYRELLAIEKAKGFTTIIVDGQPREEQVRPILQQHIPDYKRFILLHAPAEVRITRATARYETGSAEQELVVARVNNDKKTYYEVLVELLKNEYRPTVVDTSVSTKQWFVEVLDEARLIPQVAPDAEFPQ